MGIKDDKNNQRNLDTLKQHTSTRAATNTFDESIHNDNVSNCSQISKSVKSVRFAQFDKPI